ncbi:MAG: CpaF family protein [Gluconacetobacter diazotrophicus]|nr:CpaF family protein [Gluconacetobacter diazotrophicus]
MAIVAFGRKGRDIAAAAAAADADGAEAGAAAASPPPERPAASPAGADAAALAELRQFCLARIEPASIAQVPAERLGREVERLIAAIATERRIHINAREQRALAGELVDDMLGLGPLQPLLDDDTIADIMVNGPDRVFVERAGRLVLSGVRFRDAAHVANVCQRIASGVGRRVDEASPLVDARLRDGSRVNIVFPPLALDGPYVSIRKFGRHALGFEQLVEKGAMTPAMAAILQVASSARLNVIISGGTGSGKTTMMNALSRLIDPGERVVTIEDAAELRLQQPHVVRLETRPPSLEGTGEITQRDLVRNALRMRPDRVIIGEVRGGEAFDMLQAMNTGHDGSMSTIHANTARDALTRIENMVQMGNMGLPSAAIRRQIVSAVDLIVQIERQRDGVRRVVQVTEVCGMEGEIVVLNDLFRLQQTGEIAAGQRNSRYEVSRARPSFWSRLVGFGLDRTWTDAMASAEA